ncbi:MAG: hypothetical protein K1X57_01440 [Gemmataceae bacterium]|nr:hypothetical protein [Gemmataceae bacterium]
MDHKSRRVRLALVSLEDRLAPAAGVFRVVSYNIASSGALPQAGLGTILQGIGSEPVNSNSQPIDVLLLQEVASQAVTTQNVVATLNAAYGAGTYARGSLDGATTGAGTQGIVYNAQKLQLVSEAVIGTAGGAPEQPRQALRYKLQPIGYSAGAAFYVYNSHYKANNDSASLARRLVEANAIRADADALGQGVNIIYAGDFNSYSSSESFYQELLSAGNGQAFDPVNRPGNWDQTASFTDIFTQAPAVSPPNGLTGGGLDSRFDFQLRSGELADGVGLDYWSGSYHTFGNNGSVPMNGNINATTSTALPTLSNRTTILDFLTTVADHLPVVADYRIVTPAAKVSAVTINGGAIQRSRVTSLAVTFDSAVSLPANPATAFQLRRQSDNAVVNLAASVAGNTVTLTFTGGAVQSGSLADGRYTLTALSNSIVSLGGTLDGNADGQPGGDYTLVGTPANKLFRLFGDSDGDGTVTSTDFLAFRLAFLTTGSTFDSDGSGQVSSEDFLQFRLRFLATI